jgi:hypothetical protein
VVALVESIHKTLQVSLASVPPSLRRARLGALHSAVASTPWNEKEKVLKFVELTCLYPSLHCATWRMWGVGAECLWATWLSGEALGQHDRQ